MMKPSYVAITGILLALACPAALRAQSPIVVATPAKAGSVDGTTENSDAFIWRLFTEFTAPVSLSSPSPVVLETWASDGDTFTNNPKWPSAGKPMTLHGSVLAAAKTVNLGSVGPEGFILPAKTIDVPCQAPPGAAVGGFPTSGSPPPCIAEQVQRNKAQFDYIVNNNLNTQAGRAAAYANSFNVEMPLEAIAVKGDWIPLPDLLRWVPQLGDIANIRKLYYTITVNSVEYALVAMHVASRQNPNWVWGTFEHEMNPGRCDAIGCSDSFGSEIPAVPPNHAMVNTQYGACPKTKPLKDLMTNAHLSQIWEHYCLKSTEVDFVAADGTPYVLGNSVIEGIVGNGTIAASSCISCHSYASFGPTGRPTASAAAMLPFNPTGNTIPGVLTGSRPFAFMWGVLLPKPP
jgi:hypothetical protein